MSGCCTPNDSCSGASKFFSRRSKSYAKRFRKGKLGQEQEYLLAGIKGESVQDNTVLDIGCGVGQLHLTLLKEGAARSVGVDLSAEMLRKAKAFSESFGLGNRTEYIEGDFTKIASSIPESDITVLDKVVCCHEDLPTLLQTSTGKTRRIYALSHPKENFVIRAIFKTEVFLARLFRWSFTPFWHNWSEMKLQIASQGFKLVYENSTFAWQVLVFHRV